MSLKITWPRKLELVDYPCSVMLVKGHLLCDKKSSSSECRENDCRQNCKIESVSIELSANQCAINSEDYESAVHVDSTNCYFTALISLPENRVNYHELILKILVNNCTLKSIKLSFSGENAKRMYSVVPLLVIPSDCNLDPITLEEYVRRMKIGLQLTQMFYFDQLSSVVADDKEDGRTFSIDTHEVRRLQMPSFEIFNESVDKMWEILATAIFSSHEMYLANKKFVSFLVCPCSKAEKRKLGVATGGLALINISEIFKSWPLSIEIALSTLHSKTSLPDSLLTTARNFGCASMEEGLIFASSLGTVAHEIGHIFNLGHRAKGLMSQDYVKVILSYYQLTGSDVLNIEAFQKSCSLMLYYNRWFLGNTCDLELTAEDKLSEKITLSCGVVKSCNPLITIQLRDVINENVINDWIFISKCVREFKIGKNHIPLSCDSGNCILVAQDINGNILRSEISRENLSHSFTIFR